MATARKPFFKHFVLWLGSASIATAVYVVLLSFVFFFGADFNVFVTAEYWGLLAFVYVAFGSPVIILGAIGCALVQTKSRNISRSGMRGASFGIFTGFALLVMSFTVIYYLGAYILLIAVTAGIVIGLGSYLLKAQFDRRSHSQEETF